MKKVLLTCLAGTHLCRDFVRDFEERNDIELYVADMNQKAKGRVLTEKFIPLLPAKDEKYSQDLLDKAKAHQIDMIIPGSDEEALAIMGKQEMFEAAGIVAAVQPASQTPFFQSKTAMYDYLDTKNFPVPFYRTFRTTDELDKALQAAGYPQKPVLVKPNQARGGRGIILLSEVVISNKDNLALCDKKRLSSMLDGETEYLVMDYIEGTVYDVDVLRYKTGKVFFGLRKRFTNVTKLFSGNYFDNDKTIRTFCERLHEKIPTTYLLDYDLMVTEDGRIELLEINPRPSGSTISYLPFGVNLYYVLAKSYLDNETVEIPSTLEGKTAQMFYRMVEGGAL